MILCERCGPDEEAHWWRVFDLIPVVVAGKVIVRVTVWRHRPL